MNRFGLNLIKFATLFLPLAAFGIMLNALLGYRASALQAISVNEESRQIAGEIVQFRNGPKIASVEIEPPEQIAQRVTQAAELASVPASSILSIAPQSLVRIGRSAYQSRATQIVLQNVTMAQSAHFAEALEDQASGSIVRDLKVTRSRTFGNDGGDLWNVRLTLTQLVFSPISNR